MLEGDRKAGLGLQPTIGDDGDVVVGRDGLEHGNGKGDVVLVLCVSLPKDEGVVEEDDLAVDVLDQDPERLSCSVDLFVPSEVGNDGQIDTKESAGDRLDLR